MVYIEIVKDINKALKEFSLEKMRKDPRKHVIFMTPEIFNHTFSPERMKLLMLLDKEGTMSISELAEKVGRKFEAVHRDLRYLEGIVKFRKEQRRRIPYIEGSIEVKMVTVEDGPKAKEEYLKKLDKIRKGKFYRCDSVKDFEKAIEL
jgi:predicted transcriptional regulator